MNNCICNKPSIKLLGQIRNLFKDIKNNGGFNKVPKALVHYNFGLYTNEDFINDENKLVRDLSGNGYDLRLYNFAFAGMSGFGGYSENYNEYYNFGTSYVTVTPTSFEVVGSYIGMHYLVALRQPREIPSYKIKVSGVTNGHPLLYRYHIADGTPTILELYNGIYVLPKSYINETDTKRVGFMGEGGFQIGVKVEQLPIYPGGLVSDGVDDYGRCVKEFSLPDDFTVVAIRRIISGNSASLVNKGQASGAFLFESVAADGNTSNYSYGQITYSRTLPALFSYLTKTSYNGEKVTAGTAVDDDAKLLVLFTSSNKYQNTVLYDLRIYDHSLSEEELETVRDEMMSDYEKYTKPLDGITYVADWDAKGRSNDEDADVRDKWIDKATGKVINLNNFAYAGMSGWNGYERNWDKWLNVYIANNGHNYQENNVLHILEIGPWANTLSDVVSGETVKLKLRVSGLSEAITNNEVQNIQLYFNVSTAGSDFKITEDGDYDVTLTAPEDSIKFYILVKSRETLTGWTPLTTPITIEQLPLYPGALVGDGIDDYGVTQKAINEEVGTILLHYIRLIEVPKKWGYYIDGVTQNRLYIAYYQYSPYFITKLITKHNDGNIFIGELSEIIAGNTNLYLMANISGTERGQVAIYRLILIREQLDNSQLEFLKWKVDKEYREWMKKNNYNIN